MFAFRVLKKMQFFSFLIARYSRNSFRSWNISTHASKYRHFKVKCKLFTGGPPCLCLLQLVVLITLIVKCKILKNVIQILSDCEPWYVCLYT